MYLICKKCTLFSWIRNIYIYSILKALNWSQGKYNLAFFDLDHVNLSCVSVCVCVLVTIDKTKLSQKLWCYKYHSDILCVFFLMFFFHKYFVFFCFILKWCFVISLKNKKRKADLKRLLLRFFSSFVYVECMYVVCPFQSINARLLVSSFCYAKIHFWPVTENIEFVIEIIQILIVFS